MRNTKHIFRLIVILVVMLGAMLIVRNALVPPTFGQDGPFRASGIPEIMNLPLKYYGVDNCKSCHKKEWKRWRRYGHKNVSCETCHGPGMEHSTSEQDPPPEIFGTKEVMARSHKLCMSCHARVPGRSTDFPTVDAEEHLKQFMITKKNPNYDAMYNCVKCHKGHRPEKK